jgi:heme exporter protein D
MKRSSSLRQCGQVTRRVVEAGSMTSPSQAEHWKCIIEVMKPLIVMLLLAVSVQAQTLADVARQERARQARLRPARVITGTGAPAPAPAAVGAKPADAKPGTEAKAATDAKPATTDGKPAPDAKPAPPAATAVQPAAPPPPPKPDPLLEYNAQLDKLRASLRELQDQETSLQLQLNQLTNQVFATITDPATQQQAQTRLGETQQKLSGVRSELEQTRRALDALIAQGPPKQ